MLYLPLKCRKGDDKEFHPSPSHRVENSKLQLGSRVNVYCRLFILTCPQLVKLKYSPTRL